MHRVLNRRARQQEPVPAVETQRRLPPSTLRVLDRLSLIEHHVLPLDALEVLCVLHDDRVARHDHVERRVAVVGQVLLEPDLTQRRPVLHSAPIRQSAQVGNEARELLLPIVQGGSGRDDKEGTPDVVGFREVCEKGDGLHRLCEVSASV